MKSRVYSSNTDIQNSGNEPPSRKQRGIILTFTFISLLSVFCIWKYWDYFPPRTPIKVARIISGLKLPSGLEPLIYDEGDTFTGEEFTFIVYKFDKLNLSEFTRMNSFEEYVKLPIIRNIPPVPSEFYNYFSIEFYNQHYWPLRKDTLQHFNGRYKFEESENQKSYSLTIFDQIKSKLYIYYHHD